MLPPDLQHLLEVAGQAFVNWFPRGYDEMNAVALQKMWAGALEEIIYWPEEDLAEMRKVAIEVWDEMYRKTPRASELQDLYEEVLRENGLL